MQTRERCRRPLRFESSWLPIAQGLWPADLFPMGFPSREPLPSSDRKWQKGNRDCLSISGVPRQVGGILRRHQLVVFLKPLVGSFRIVLYGGGILKAIDHSGLENVFVEEPLDFVRRAALSDKFWRFLDLSHLLLRHVRRADEGNNGVG